MLQADDRPAHAAIDESEVRTAALARAAARFGRYVLRNPAAVGLVQSKLLRRLEAAIQSTASLGHRTSIVLWGPSEGGKRATMEVLCQIFCVSVDRATHAVLRHPGNVSSDIGANRGVPVVGIVLDGAALRTDNDAVQSVLTALYNFWFLVAETISGAAPSADASQQQLGSDKKGPKTRSGGGGAKMLHAAAAPYWARQADEILAWLFDDVLPDSMHRQAPPGSVASASAPPAASTASVQQKQQHHAAGSFRAAAQQTFRVWTHGGNTVLTALQHTLLELSKAGVSPCFFIHDVRALGQNCDKVLYMISGLLHEQELRATECESSIKGSAKAAASSSSSGQRGGGNGNGGGMSIVMTSTSPDLRLEKRLSSRMNCDFLHCPAVAMPFISFLHLAFTESDEERLLLDRQLQIQREQLQQAAQLQQQARQQRAAAPRRRGRAPAAGRKGADGSEGDDDAGEDVRDQSENQAQQQQQQQQQQSLLLVAFMERVRACERRFLAALASRDTSVHREYAALTRRCEALSRPAHVVRRLLETWFELANDLVPDFTAAPLPIAVLEQRAFAELSPLAPLDAAATDRSATAPREVVGLLACALSCAASFARSGGGGGSMLQAGAAAASPFRTIQEHYAFFQELRTGATYADSVDAWTKAAILLQRWGIVRCTNPQQHPSAAASSRSGGGGGGAGAIGNSGQANAAMTVTSTSRVEIDMRNLDHIRAKVEEFFPTIYDVAMLTAVKALLR